MGRVGFIVKGWWGIFRQKNAAPKGYKLGGSIKSENLEDILFLLHMPVNFVGVVENQGALHFCLYVYTKKW